MPRPLYPRERAPGAHWVGGWVDPRAVLDLRYILVSSSHLRLGLQRGSSLEAFQHIFRTHFLSPFDSRWGLGIFLFTTVSRTAFRPIQPHIEWISEPLSLGEKRSGREADNLPPSSSEVKNP